GPKPPDGILVTTPAAAAVLTGSVTFLDGGKPLGSAALDGSGSATLVLPPLGPGSHSITAAYRGDGNFSGSTSPAVTKTLAVPPPRQHPTITLQIDGLTTKLPAGVSVESYQWSETAALSATPVKTAPQAHFHLVVDKSLASPRLFIALISRRLSAKAVITVYTPDHKVYLTWTLLSVLVTSYHTHLGGQSRPTDAIDLAFQKIKLRGPAATPAAAVPGVGLLALNAKRQPILTGDAPGGELPLDDFAWGATPGTRRVNVEDFQLFMHSSNASATCFVPAVENPGQHPFPTVTIRVRNPSHQAYLTYTLTDARV